MRSRHHLLLTVAGLAAAAGMLILSLASPERRLLSATVAVDGSPDRAN